MRSPAKSIWRLPREGPPGQTPDCAGSPRRTRPAPWLRARAPGMSPPLPRPATPTKRSAPAASATACSPCAGPSGGKRVSLGGEGPAAAPGTPAPIRGFDIVSPFAGAPGFSGSSGGRPPPAPAPPARRLEPELAALAPAGSASPAADPQVLPVGNLRTVRKRRQPRSETCSYSSSTVKRPLVSCAVVLPACQCRPASHVRHEAPRAACETPLCAFWSFKTALYVCG